MTNLRVDSLTVSYRRHPAVHHVSGTFAPGSLTAIIGPNGAGKSTLLKAIAGILAPDEGRITLDPPAHVAYLPQATELQRDFPFSVLQMVTTGFWQKTGGFGAITTAHREQAMQALARVGLGGFDKRHLSTLSAGQFQRAMFARILVQDAPVILLDEPFTSIDSDTTENLMAMVLSWHKEGRTVIAVLHELEQVRRYFPESLLLARKCVAWGKSAEVLQPKYLSEAKLFQAAWTKEAEECHQ